MKRSSKFARINLIAILFIAALLITLFTFPRQHLEKVTQNIKRLTDKAISAAYACDWNLTQTHLAEMETIFRQERNSLKLFLDHEQLRSFEASIQGCRHLSACHETGQLLFELQGIKKQAEYLLSIETFSLFNLF